MARIRTIKPEFPQSESMGRITRDARLLFVMLWTIADDLGRARGASRMIASLLFPYDDDAPKLVDGWLAELEREGCVARYQVDGASYLEILNWTSHQKIDKPSGSKIPPFDESSRTFSRPREVSSEDQGPRTKDQGPKDQGTKPSPSPSASTPAAPEFISFPCVGKGSKTVSITTTQVEGWERDFPGVDVPQALRKMRAWLEANPQKQKTAKGVPAFVVNWLGRDQDAPLAPSGPPRAGGAPTKRPAAPLAPSPAKPATPKSWATRETELRSAAQALGKSPEETEAWIAEAREEWGLGA